jgi:FKBP-type peptidyl-prolyl cis-trans isomerase
MSLFKRKAERRKPPPKPAWLKWLLLAFLGYAFIVMSLPGKMNNTLQTVKTEIKQHEVAHFGDYKEKIFPENATTMRISDVEDGKGQQAVCGQRVSIAYDAFLAQGNALADKASKDTPLTFTIGNGHVMPVFDRGVIGMKTGGKRSIIATPLMSYGLEDYKRDDVPPGASVRMEIELLSVEPKLPIVDDMPYRLAEVAPGKGLLLVCGEKVSIGIKIWDIGGKLLYSNTDKDGKPLIITLGKAEVMLGLEQGVIGMQEGGYRLLIIPPAYQQTMWGKEPKFAFPMPKNQTVLVEVAAYELPNP